MQATEYSELNNFDTIINTIKKHKKGLTEPMYRQSFFALWLERVKVLYKKCLNRRQINLKRASNINKKRFFSFVLQFFQAYK